MRFDQIFYSILHFNFHFQNIDKELQDISEMANRNNLKVKSAIDVGCGDGEITEKLKKIMNLKEIYGLDLNKKLLDVAEKRGITAIRADLDSYNSKRRYDLVISYGSLHHFKNTNEFIKKLKTLSSIYILIVDNTVRKNFFHKITGSKHFIFESSKYPIRKADDIINSSKKARCRVIDVKINKNANIWHDRSIILLKV